MASPLVSVIMPMHNAAQYLAEAIQSVVNQTFKSWELIVSDDASNDGSADLVRHFSRVDPRVKLVEGSERGGPAKARNRAITFAEGRWLALLDSDDLWHPDKLSITLDFAQTSNLALVYTSYYRVSAGEPVKLIEVPEAVTYRKLLKTNHIATSTVMVSREMVPDFSMDEAFKFDDYATWLEMLKAGLPAGGLLLPMTTYRKHEGSFSSSKIEAARRVYAILSKQEDLSSLEIGWYFLNYLMRGAYKHSVFAGKTEQLGVNQGTSSNFCTSARSK